VKERIFSDLVAILAPDVIVEFGSWEGASALAWASELGSLGHRGHIYCNDTWLGSVGHRTNTIPMSEWSFAHLRLLNGEPFLFETLCNAVTANGFGGMISPVRASTSHGTAFLRQQSVKANLVYVDARHSYSDAYRVLVLANSVMTTHGVIASDDWPWRGVRIAVVAFSAKHRRQILVSPDKVRYVLLPREESRVSTALIQRGYRITSGAGETVRVGKTYMKVGKRDSQKNN